MFNVRYLTLINRTAAIDDGYVDAIDNLFLIELGFIIWSYIECGSMLYMLYATNEYHPNLTLLLKHLVGQYFVSMAARTVQILKMYKVDPTEELRTDYVFTIATLVRNSLTFIAFYFAPFAMIERAFATYYMQDYEHEQRRELGYKIVIIMHCVCLLSAIAFILELVPVYVHVTSFILANVMALIICFINDNCNKRRFYYRMRNGYLSNLREYSLSERYQICENMRTAHLFKRGILFIIVFSITCSSFISADALAEENQSLKNWMHVGFNYAAILYGCGLPAAMYYYNEQWKDELMRLFRKVAGSCLNNEGHPRQLRTTTGENMMPQKSEEGPMYFDQLHTAWN